MAQIICKECGNEYSDESSSCNACGCPSDYNLQKDKTIIGNNAPISQEENTVKDTKEVITASISEKKVKDWFKILLLIIMIGILVISLAIKIDQGMAASQKWEYKTLVFYPTGSNSRTGAGSETYNSIVPSELELNQLGAEGWELVTSHLEMETAYPNFGSEQYVTGIQPNVRPQSVVLIFKRPLQNN